MFKRKKQCFRESERIQRQNGMREGGVSSSQGDAASAWGDQKCDCSVDESAWGRHPTLRGIAFLPQRATAARRGGSAVAPTELRGVSLDLFPRLAPGATCLGASGARLLRSLVLG